MCVGFRRTIPISGHEDHISQHIVSLWVEIQKSGKTPQIIHLFIGFSIILTIHFGGFPPIFGTIHMDNKTSWEISELSGPQRSWNCSYQNTNSALLSTGHRFAFKRMAQLEELASEEFIPGDSIRDLFIPYLEVTFPTFQGVTLVLTIPKRAQSQNCQVWTYILKIRHFWQTNFL